MATYISARTRSDISGCTRTYVASGQELFRLHGRTFAPVARAARVIRSVVAPSDSAIFVGEPGLVQRVTPDGTVTTILRVSLTGLGEGPRGSIYVVTSGAVDHLVGHRLVPVVRASQFAGLPRVPPKASDIGFANVAIDAAGNAYVTAGAVGNISSRSRARGERATSAPLEAPAACRPHSLRDPVVACSSEFRTPSCG